ncbi:MAG: C39 family peptidase [Candidatus Sungbacteria bacterium]|nr:C39 family peptidase [Candidatus Sungbacteria bacterium]
MSARSFYEIVLGCGFLAIAWYMIAASSTPDSNVFKNARVETANASLPALSRIVLPVPFVVQAPTGNWAQPWQDYCEEASVVMAAHFLWGLPIIPLMAELEMQIIEQYEVIAFRRHRDTSIDETADIMRRLYGFKNISVRPIRSKADMKDELKNGRPVIVPAAGRMLENPYFKAPGPFYHMLVVIGFDDTKDVFITNDPGTRRGASYAYNQQKLFAAIHDWNNGDVLRGEKKMIVVGR